MLFEQSHPLSTSKGKLPIVANVGEMCGDQKAARSCYLAFLKESSRLQPALLIEPRCVPRAETDGESLSPVEEINKEMLPGEQVVQIGL